MGAPRRIVRRYVTGELLAGPVTDATYLRRARRPLVLGARVSTWEQLPGWKRQLVRVAPVAVVAEAEAAQVYAAHPTLTVAGTVPLAAYGAVRMSRAARRRWRMRRFNATYVVPTVSALRPALGDAPVRLTVSPELGSLVARLAKPMSPFEEATRKRYAQYVEPAVRWLPDRTMRAVWAMQAACKPATKHLELFRRPQPSTVGPSIELAASVPYLTVEQRQHISAVIGAKIPVGDLVEAWDMVGTQATARWTVRKQPPGFVGYADLVARFKQLDEDEFFVGLGADGKPVIVSLSDDSPHVACSAGSGAGKTVLAELFAVQVLARGGLVLIIDRKGSHRWARGLRGVQYCITPEAMHDALIFAAEEADARNLRSFHEAEGWDPGRRVFVIFEEMNATVAMLRQYWENTRAKGDPKTSPAIQGFRDLMFMGRSAKHNLFGIAQMLTAQTTGGPESRENFGTRCLARYTRNAWKMLAPEAGMPRASRTIGRWQIVRAGAATETQVCYLTAPEARLFVAKMSPTSSRPGDNSWSEPIKGDARVSGDTGTPEPADPLSERITLREAVDRGLAPWKYAAAKKRLQRARAGASPTAPRADGRAGNADLYRIGDLIVWIETELGVAVQATEVEQ